MKCPEPAAPSATDVTPCTSTGRRAPGARNGNLFNEPRIFASGMPLPVDHPEPYGVLIDEAALDWLVVMEDVSLRGGDPRDSTRPLSIDQVANGVRDLARLHRAYWGFSAATHPALAWVQTWAPTEGFHSALRKRVSLGLVARHAAAFAELETLDALTALESAAR